jgi:hypothetical protein
MTRGSLRFPQIAQHRIECGYGKGAALPQEPLHFGGGIPNFASGILVQSRNLP